MNQFWLIFPRQAVLQQICHFCLDSLPNPSILTFIANLFADSCKRLVVSEEGREKNDCRMYKHFLENDL